MKRRATTGGKVGKARRRSVKRRHIDRRIPTLTDLEKQLRKERRENAETRRQLSEALEHQTATSEVLKVISSSPGNLESVFQSMLTNAVRICEAKFGQMFLVEGSGVRLIADVGGPPALVEQRGTFPPFPNGPLDLIIRTRQIVQMADIAAEKAEHPLAKWGHARSYVGVPMVKEAQLIGIFAIYRQEVRPFTNKQIELLENFAAQAVIAIENARLLNELRQRTDDLTELLEQQTATSEVLNVISSSPGELEPVFHAMLENAMRICEARFGMMYRYDGDAFRHAAILNAPQAFADFVTSRGPYLPGRHIAQPHPADQRGFHTPTGLRTSTTWPRSEVAGARSLVAVPMLKDNELVGAIIIYRQEVRPFTDKQIELVQNFAAQAVIAIENTRLLNELRQRTDDLTELLEQQTATSEVLKVISSSPGRPAARLQRDARECHSHL